LRVERYTRTEKKGREEKKRTRKERKEEKKRTDITPTAAAPRT
jgi:hypothetical protein